MNEKKYFHFARRWKIRTRGLEAMGTG